MQFASGTAGTASWTAGTANPACHAEIEDCIPKTAPPSFRYDAAAGRWRHSWHRDVWHQRQRLAGRRQRLDAAGLCRRHGRQRWRRRRRHSRQQRVGAGAAAGHRERRAADHQPDAHPAKPRCWCIHLSRLQPLSFVQSCGPQSYRMQLPRQAGRAFRPMQCLRQCTARVD